MSASSVHCYVLGGDVSVISDLNGNVTNVVCPEFVRITHGCLKKNRESSGFIAVVLKKVSDQAIGTRGSYCEFAEPKRILS
jgi:hypothetical protein